MITGVVGGTLVSAEGDSTADLLVADGRIVAMGPGIASGVSTAIDATGCYVLPGLVDAHVHFRDPGAAHKEGAENGGLAAAAGGVTTVIVMPTDKPLTSSPTEIAEKIALGRRSQIDFALSAIIGPQSGPLEELASAGCCVFDIFLAGVPPQFRPTDAAELLRFLRAVADIGGVAGITPSLHSLLEAALAASRSVGSTPAAFILSRPPVAETAGIALACELALAAGCRLHVRQVSTWQSVELLRHFKARAPGLISAETMPHNLLLGPAEHDRFGALGLMSPPMRGGRHAAALWDGLRDGTIDIIATDHAPHLVSEKTAPGADIWSIPPGIPGLETLLPVLLKEWRAGRVTLSDIVRWTATAPATLFGLAPRKGALVEGADADLVVLDPSGSRAVRAANMVTRAKYTPFEGMEVPGRAAWVIQRGRVIARDGQPVGDPDGRFLRPSR
jgi:dihydroorotase